MLLIDRLRKPKVIINQRAGHKIGRYTHGTPLILPYICPHLLLSGVTGSGKSTVLRHILETVAKTDATIYGIDMKFGVELRSYVKRLEMLATEIKQVDILLTKVRHEIERRAEILKNSGQENWGTRNRIYIFVDEIAELSAIPAAAISRALTATGVDKELTAEIRRAKAELSYRQDLIAGLARLSRSFGVTIVCGTQYATANVINTQLRANLDARICCRQATPEGFDVGLAPGFRHLHGTIGAGQYLFYTYNFDHSGNPFLAKV